MGDKITKSPHIRFAGFTDDWEQRTFDDLADYKKGPFGSAITKDMFIPKSKDSVKVYEQQNAIGKDWRLERYFISKEHAEKLKSFKVSGEDIIVSCAGTIGEIYEIPSNAESGIINQALMRIRVNNKVIDKRMFILLFSIMIDHFSSVHSNGSAIKNIPPFADLKPTIAFVPKMEEQIKIGKYFNNLDNLITLHQRKLELLKVTKKSMLQKMFPKDGESVPEIRFAGFTDAWEQRKLGEMLEERNEQIPENDEYPLMSFVQGAGVAPKGDRYDRSFLVKEDNKKYKKTELGDFIYSSNNLETGSIGFNRTGKAVISPVYSIFSSKSELESRFIGILSTRKDFIAKMLRFRQGVVYGQWRIHERDFLDISIAVPKHEEQKEIINFFANIDNLIALQERELDLLKDLKKSMLQQMFI